MTDITRAIVDMTGVDGGVSGHWGMDLSLSFGAAGADYLPWPEGLLAYYTSRKFSDDISNGIGINEPELARRLTRASIEFYPRDKVRRRNEAGVEALWPKYLGVRTAIFPFERRHGHAPSIVYSPHIGVLQIPEVHYSRINYASMHGYITKGGNRVFDYTLAIKMFGNGAVVGYPGRYPKLYGYQNAGNDPGSSYYNTGPVVPGDYMINLLLTAPNGERFELNGQAYSISDVNVVGTMPVESFVEAAHRYPQDPLSLVKILKEPSAELARELEQEARNLNLPRVVLGSGDEPEKG